MPDGEAYQPTLSLFGNKILNADQTIDRKKLGSIVFSDPALLAQLNMIVHPAVFRLEEQYFAEFASRDPHGIGVIEAAILIETGGYRALDKLIVTSCALETQIARAMTRDHVTREEAMLRIARQMPDAERIRHANWVIHTDGSPEETIAQTETIHAELRQLAEAF